MYDVVVVGGGSAGLSAALILGRARRSTLVLDAGSPRNAPSNAAHGVFTRDGTPPAELLRIGREQLRPYSDVETRAIGAKAIEAAGGEFQVETYDGEIFRARAVLLAHGVVDDLPELPGIEELWGKSVVHCPYCHGWEVRDQPLAYLANGEAALEFGSLLRVWSRDLVLCTNGPADLSSADRDRLTANGIEVFEQTIERLDGSDGELHRILFADGSSVKRRALFVRPPQRLSSPLAASLGCELTPSGSILVDQLGQTTVAGVYAAGDVMTPLQQVIRAAAAGAAAAAAINRYLANQDFERASSKSMGAAFA